MRAPIPLLLLAAVACSDASTTGGPPPPEECTCGPRVCGKVCGLTCGLCPDDGVCAIDQLSCMPALPMGAACATDLACGTGRICLRDDPRVPGGYCARRCADADPCPTGTVCGLGPFGEDVCLASCDPSGAPPTCRLSEGYACSNEGACTACVATCTGKTCGDNGCGKSCGTCLASGTICDAATCKSVYTPRNPLPAATWDLAAIDHQGLVTLVGGREIVRYVSGTVGSKGVKRVLRYDTQTGQFLTLPELPEPLARPLLAVVGSALFVAGGTVDTDTENAAETAGNNLYIRNTAGWRKVTTAGFPGASIGGAAAGANGRLWVFLGQLAAGISNRVDSFDPVTERWKGEKNRPTSRMLAAAVADGQRIWLIGGWNGTEAVGTVEILDTAAGTWSTSAPLPLPVASPRATLADGRIFIFGGWEGPESADARPIVQVIDTQTRTATQIGVTYNSLVGQAAVTSRDGDVFLFGARETMQGVLIPHDEVVAFRVPAK